MNGDVGQFCHPSASRHPSEGWDRSPFDFDFAASDPSWRWGDGLGNLLMSIVGIIVALILIVIAFKVLTGIVKIGAILAVVLIAAYLVSQGVI